MIRKIFRDLTVSFSWYTIGSNGCYTYKANSITGERKAIRNKRAKAYARPDLVWLQGLSKLPNDGVVIRK